MTKNGATRIIEKLNQLPPISGAVPDHQFRNFIKKYEETLIKIVLGEKNRNEHLKHLNFRIGCVYPPNAVISEEIKRLCHLEYPRADGRCLACGGITDRRKGCPPYSPEISETIKLLKESSVFLLMQFENIEDRTIQKYIHNFTIRSEISLKNRGFQPLMSYTSGPCRACINGCTTDEPCRNPKARRFALESCGFWLNALCESASRFTIFGDNNWKIEWIKDWGLSSQNKNRFKSVTGILLK